MGCCFYITRRHSPTVNTLIPWPLTIFPHPLLKFSLNLRYRSCFENVSIKTGLHNFSLKMLTFLMIIFFSPAMVIIFLLFFYLQQHTSSIKVHSILTTMELMFRHMSLWGHSNSNDLTHLTNLHNFHPDLSRFSEYLHLFYNYSFTYNYCSLSAVYADTRNSFLHNWLSSVSGYVSYA